MKRIFRIPRLEKWEIDKLSPILVSKQYSIIGSDEKVVHSRSPRFGRVRIGQFGIGKFASLAAASRYELLTRHKDFSARWDLSPMKETRSPRLAFSRQSQLLKDAFAEE